MKSLKIHPFAREMAETANRLYAKGLVPARAGNISGLHEGLLWVTAAGLGMRDVTPENLVMIWPDGRVVANEGRAPSTEFEMHRRVYEARPDIGAVVHAHPPRASALAVAHQALDEPILSEMTISLGSVPVVEYHPPGTPALADAVAEALKTHDAALMANHGVITVGKTLADAFYNMELVESFAEVYLNARQLGRLNTLTPEQVKATQGPHP
jgi:L-fuculose-phosphate aldolase